MTLSIPPDLTGAAAKPEKLPAVSATFPLSSDTQLPSVHPMTEIHSIYFKNNIKKTS